MVSTRWEKQEAERKRRRRLRMREWRIESSESILGTREQQKRREAAGCPGRKVAGRQELHSSLPEMALTRKTVLSCIHSTKWQLDSSGERMALPAKPATSGVWLSLVASQVAQMLLSKSAGGSAADCVEGDNSSSSAAPASALHLSMTAADSQHQWGLIQGNLECLLLRDSQNCFLQASWGGWRGF